MPFEKINALSREGTPFLFLSDFKAENVEVFTLDELKKSDIEFAICEEYVYKAHPHFLKKSPLDFALYKKKFDAIIEEIRSGNTYILNLTQPTVIDTELSLQEIYALANAHYKLRYKDEFVCFSPEKFVQINDDIIHTFPMKGTIDAAIPHAEEKILANAKEMAEHIMIVDLLRNDLSIVARDVKVDRFRYTQKIQAGEKELWQVSSHISGVLPKDWREHLGDILHSLLPAGSISGAPKKSTLDIIEKTEMYERGFFSGVFGLFDGQSFDSGVMIRFIEKTRDGYVYKSGGGITLDSDAVSEYEEMLDKIYLP
ncbi:aminodeoxychorismate synthase component I [Sulfurimonas paralvinellae]|uniref:Aminodeoxychorismate synthase component I n=1 Tax=Sulfurimonas paralvinellae TaxID=317658 RepID=A0A7M1BBQ1_9BACT|nr:aminodeoxychorismate synthase component I [Sulfurimonas paralvinellae]QOP46222.1 aminodeoxychorismate synthase component I [Sulfurimonas paralvinellae]